jgi:predicted transcriptional regulator
MPFDIMPEVAGDLRNAVTQHDWERVDDELDSFSNNVTAFFVTRDPSCIARSEALLGPILRDLEVIEKSGRNDVHEAHGRLSFARGLLTVMRQTRTRLEFIARKEAARTYTPSPNAMALLCVLFREVKPVSNIELSVSTGIRAETVSRELNKLEQAGFVYRYRGGRSMKNSLTSKFHETEFRIDIERMCHPAHIATADEPKRAHG